MAELRKHRNLSETVFGLMLEGSIDPNSIDGNMLVYPYNVAIERLPTEDHAGLALDFGAEAINAAVHAAERANGFNPEHYVRNLVKVYRDFRIVNVMERATKKIDKGEQVDFDDIKGLIEARQADENVEPVAWSHIKGDFEHEWLWTGWIPAGETTILVGEQGSGKSALALYLANAFANGEQLPDGSYPAEKTGVLWIETEGRQGENIRRARAWGVDATNIYSPEASGRRVIDLTQPEDKALIRSHAMRPEVGLVVIDSLGGSLMNENEASAKKVLQEIGRMAQETDTTFLIIHHLRKPSSQRKGYEPPTLHSVRGHSGITQFAPSVIAIEYEGHESPRFLYHLKMNLVDQPGTLSFTIGALGPLFSEDAGSEVLRAITEECLSWLEDTLETGPMEVRDVVAKAEEAGYEKKLIQRAINYPSVRLVHIDGKRCLIKA